MMINNKLGAHQNKVMNINEKLFEEEIEKCIKIVNNEPVIDSNIFVEVILPSLMIEVHSIMTTNKKVRIIDYFNVFNKIRVMKLNTKLKKDVKKFLDEVDRKVTEFNDEIEQQNQYFSQEEIEEILCMILSQFSDKFKLIKDDYYIKKNINLFREILKKLKEVFYEFINKEG